MPDSFEKAVIVFKIEIPFMIAVFQQEQRYVLA
jgi:hypothetical protein